MRKLFSALVGNIVITAMLTGCTGMATTSAITPLSPASTSAAVPSTSAAPSISVPSAPGTQPARETQPTQRVQPVQDTPRTQGNNSAERNNDTSTAKDTTAATASPTTAAPTTAVSVTASPVAVSSTALNSQAFPGNVLLGKPTNNSITLSLLAPVAAELFIQYGEKTNQYNSQTSISTLQKDQPLVIQLTGLNKDTQYYYRICHKAATEASFNAGTEGTFVTQRVPGESFVFTVDADPHWDDNTDPAKVKLVFQNILNEHPDFNIDMGDTFMTQKLAPKSYQETAGIYANRRSYFSIFGGSVPLYMVLGNHDGRQTWDKEARDVYFTNPSPDNFYSGSGSRNYYSWEWGDSLFVVLDPYSSTIPKAAAGWDWTLGKAQYDWLKSTLENSQAKYKFVFAHHLVGGFDLGSAGNGRGGVEAARFYEWGGQNTDGTLGFEVNRPGWGKPIQQLFIDNHVTIFFHGHDHLYAYQQLNGVVYQECPQPGSGGNEKNAILLGYTKGVFMPSPGHICVSVSDVNIKVDYIRTYTPGREPAGHTNGELAYSYTINPDQPGPK